MKNAFSLIELLVVVAIVALLAALATPLYINYKNRVLVSEAYNAMQGLQDLAVAAFTKNGNSWTNLNSLNYAGTSLAQAAWTSTPNLNASGVYALSWNPNTGVSTTNIIIYAVVTGLRSVTNYVDATQTGCHSASAGCYNAIALMTKEINGTEVTKCGLDTPGSTYYLPLSVQPSTCTCSNLNTWWASGTGC